MTIELAAKGPFSLAQSIAFSEGLGADASGGAEGVFHAALVDDDGTPAAFAARQVGATVAIEHDGGLDDARMCAHAARILSVDVDARGLDAVAKRDPVVAALLEEFPGRRPVCFPTPYEAAAWSVLSQRTSMRQAAAVKRGLAQALGRHVAVGGWQARAFPGPAAILEATELPGVGGLQRAQRLRGVAEAALDGRLDPELLRGFAEPEEAIEHLTGIHGVGPFSALLILTRGAGHPDVAPPTTIARARAALAQPYGLDASEIDAVRAGQLAEPWRPYRSWVFFLLRNRVQE